MKMTITECLYINVLYYTVNKSVVSNPPCVLLVLKIILLYFSLSEICDIGFNQNRIIATNEMNNYLPVKMLNFFSFLLTEILPIERYG